MLQEYKYYTKCMRAIIWTNDARIIVKRPRMLSTQSVALYKTCKPKPRLSTHICVTRPQWVKTEKDNELPIPGRFSNQIGILDIQSTRGILRFGVFFSKSLIYGGYLRFPKSRGRQKFNWFPIVTEFRVKLTASVGCCLFDLDAIKPWINISLMDQTKLFQLRTALLWERAYGCMTTRRLIIQWSQKILIIDIIISWKLLWDQRPQTIRILHEWNTETPHFQSKRVLLPELLTCSREDRLPNRLIQITRIDQTLPILIQPRPFLLTWINVNSSMDK